MFTDWERTLIEGPDDAVGGRLTADRCLVVDWRGDEEELLRDLDEHLPEGETLRYDLEEREPESMGVKLEYRGRTAELTLTPTPGNNLRVLQRAAALFAPELLVRLFRCTAGSDTHAFLVRPAAWWRALDQRHPGRAESLFQDVADLTKLWDLDRPPAPERDGPGARGRRPWWKFW